MSKYCYNSLYVFQMLKDREGIVEDDKQQKMKKTVLQHLFHVKSIPKNFGMLY